MKGREHKGGIAGRRGFTLLELVFALIVLAILLGVGITGASHFWKGEKVEASARKMQSVMMRAMRLGVAEQKPYAIAIDATQVRLIRASDVLLVESGDEDGEVASIEQVSLPTGLEVFVRRWQEEDWRRVELEILDFPVSGICEPVAFRLVDGGDVLEFTLHPLTAFPVEETLVVE